MEDNPYRSKRSRRFNGRRALNQPNTQTAEALFEGYLRAQGLPFEYENLSGTKKPDYLVHHSSGDCIFEVKEIRDPADLPTRGFSPDLPVVRKISRTKEQFREYKQYPCNLVLFSDSMFGPSEPAVVLSAAFGPGFQQAGCDYEKIDPNPPCYRFPRKSELPPDQHFLSDPALSPVCNTTFSSIILLTRYSLDDFGLEVWRRLYARQEAGESIEGGEQYRVIAEMENTFPRSRRFEGTVRAIVMENPYARIRLPADIFRGPFDQRWGWQDGWCRLVWLGSTLKSLYRDGVPFQML